MAVQHGDGDAWGRDRGLKARPGRIVNAGNVMDQTVARAKQVAVAEGRPTAGIKALMPVQAKGDE